jgi:peptidoglycan/LPS O-acetylase OafA/YrhL
MSEQRPNASFALIFLFAAVLFQSISGVFGGAILIADPSGATISLSHEHIENTALGSYLVPGIVLLFLLGAAPAAVAYGLWRQRPWALWGCVLVGVMVMIWIAVELLVIGYLPEPRLQAIYGVLGVLMVIVALLPSVRRKYLKKQSP